MPQRWKLADDQLFVERLPEGDYAVRRGGSERASAVLPTQGEAINRARGLNPGHSPLVERVRRTAAGKAGQMAQAVGARQETHRGPAKVRALSRLHNRLAGAAPTGAGWTANIASEDRALFARMKMFGAKVIVAQNRDDMLQRARAYTDGLLNEDG